MRKLNPCHQRENCTLRNSATQVPAANPMSIGDGKQYVAQNLIMSASNDQGNAVLNNMGGRCQMNRLIDTVAKIVEAHGYCAYTGADNDQIFEKCDFLPGKPNTCELTGGTGKFQGLQGSLSRRCRLKVPMTALCKPWVIRTARIKSLKLTEAVQPHANRQIAFMPPRCTLPGSARRHKLGIQRYKDRAAGQIATLFERAA